MAAAQGILTCLGDDLPANSGSLRRIKVLLRENCVVGIPRFPHSCSVATTNLTDIIVNVTQAAFSELGDGHGYAHGNYCNSAAAGVASGTDWRRDGEPYINQMFMMGGGGGASATCDGMHYLFVPVAAGLLYRDSIEINEQRFPIKVDSMKTTTDSMGHGRRRGGPATRVVLGPRKDKMSILHVCNGLESSPKGVRGGTGSKLGGNVKIARDGTETKYPAVMVCEIEEGEKLRADDQGGGGYGNPLDREVERVLNDVAERYVSIEIARNVYGVVIEGKVANDSLAANIVATKKLRAEMRT
jgi:N-methylhydantoinase B